MIQTKEFGLSKHEYAKIALIHCYIRYWGLFFGVMLVLFFFILNSKNNSYISLISIAIIYPTIVTIGIYIQGLMETNKFVFKPKILFIDKEKISAKYGINSVFETEFTSELPWDGISKAFEIRKYWLLYISRAQFLAIPKSAFMSHEDIEHFRRIIKSEV